MCQPVGPSVVPFHDKSGSRVHWQWCSTGLVDGKIHSHTLKQRQLEMIIASERSSAAMDLSKATVMYSV